MAIKSGQVAGINNPDNTASVWRYTLGTGSIILPDAITNANRLYMIVNQTGTALTISSYNDLAGVAKTTLNTCAAIIVSDGVSWLQIRQLYSATKNRYPISLHCDVPGKLISMEIILSTS